MKSTVKIWRETEERYEHFGQVGKVVSWSEIYQPPKGFGDQKYVVVIVEIGDSVKTVGQLVGNTKIKSGDKVVGVLRRLRQPEKGEVIEYGVKWRRI